MGFIDFNMGCIIFYWGFLGLWLNGNNGGLRSGFILVSLFEGIAIMTMIKLINR